MSHSTTKLRTLQDIESATQQRWAVERTYEADAPTDAATPARACDGTPATGKFFVTFPYPYMNGRLHLGHAFSLTKSEFAARFWRMKGRHVLWPFGLHVTGTPIAACAQKLANEMAKYGTPPVFPPELLEDMAAAAEEKKAAAEAAGQHKSKKGKAAPPKPQWLIMQGMGIADSDIPKFADPQHWLKFFPPLALTDLKAFGCHIDYRRSFITTATNPFYDGFVSWQFRKLRERGLLHFGKRYSIYSPLDGQPCADHDRASGEGVLPTEYTVVKLRVRDPAAQPGLAPFAALIGDRDVILPAATLRAETVVGQTNAWISTNFAYKAYIVAQPAAADGAAAATTPATREQVFLMTAKSARNLAYQGFTVNGVTASDDFAPLFEVHGKDLLGLPLAAPLCPFETIYTLPMATINEMKGTGVVMSVPSDSPDDYINYISLRNKPDNRARLGVRDEWVAPFEPVLIIDALGDTFAAKTACERLKINGPGAADLLEEAKKAVYQTGFYSGVMITGPFAGKKVSEAKVETAKLLLAAGDAIRYFEPTKPVVSRSGDECVVGLVDQWYIEYGKREWKQLVSDHLQATLNTFTPGVRNAFTETLGWLAEWPCSRTFGLGTLLPADASKTMIIDSLSDSTIYMAYYTVARFLHTPADPALPAPCIDGSVPNVLGVTPAMMTDAAWDYVLCGTGTAEELQAATGLPAAAANAMRREFEFWYPVDLRVSAKDLIQNHLTMFLYNHAAIWPNDAATRWPRAIYCNGHILVDGEKMSKSKGNFISLADAVARFGADPTRMACADAGDSLDDANFLVETAVGFIMKINSLYDSAREMLAASATMRSGAYTLFDRIFDNEINAAIIAVENAYEQMQFRVALGAAFYELGNNFSAYRLNCDGMANLHGGLVRRYFETIALLLMPIAPHFSEHMWSAPDLLNHGATSSVMAQRFPAPTASVSYQTQVAARVINEVIREVRAQAGKASKAKGAAAAPPSEMFVYAASTYLEWQQRALAALRAVRAAAPTGTPAGELVKQVQAAKEPWMTPALIPEMMAFLKFALGNAERYGDEALADAPACDDVALLTEALPVIVRLTGVATVHVRPREQEDIAEHKVARGKARPGEPAVTFPPKAK